MSARFVIVGNGVAGVTAARTLRAREPNAQITIVGGESDYFFSRTALMYAYMDRLDLRDLQPFERKTYDRRKVNRIRDRVIDIDADRRIVQLQAGAAISDDRLLLATGSLPNRIPWPGLNRISEGVAHKRLAIRSAISQANRASQVAWFCWIRQPPEPAAAKVRNRSEYPERAAVA